MELRCGLPCFNALPFSHLPRNKYGQLGLGDFENRSVPTLVKALVGVPLRQVSCGWDHTAAVATGGQLYTWGRGTWGQTGHPHQVSPAAQGVAGSCSWALGWGMGPAVCALPVQLFLQLFFVLQLFCLPHQLALQPLCSSSSGCCWPCRCRWETSVGVPLPRLHPRLSHMPRLPLALALAPSCRGTSATPRQLVGRWRGRTWCRWRQAAGTPWCSLPTAASGPLGTTTAASWAAVALGSRGFERRHGEWRACYACRCCLLQRAATTAW